MQLLKFNYEILWKFLQKSNFREFCRLSETKTPLIKTKPTIGITRHQSLKCETLSFENPSRAFQTFLPPTNSSRFISFWSKNARNLLFFVKGGATVAMAIVARLGVNIAANIGFQWAAEILPTVVRAQGVSLIHIIGYAAHIMGPYVIYLVIKAKFLYSNFNNFFNIFFIILICGNKIDYIPFTYKFLLQK